MPYKAGQIPSGAKKLPAHGQAIYRSAFNSAHKGGASEESAHAIAWAAVKKKYKKKGERWVSIDGDRVMRAMDKGRKCPECDGEGELDNGDTCPECDGTGYITDAHPLQLTEDGAFVCDNDGKTLVRKTKDGYLVAEARIARSGIQIYGGDEIGIPHMKQVRVYRPPEEVFSKDAMKSLAHRPLTLNHPPVMVDATNWDEFSIGHIGEPVTRDGEFIRVPLVIMDGKAIEAYEKHGVKELSVGYSTNLIWGKGTTPSGETYDAKQTAIRGNHLAVVPAARGGSLLRIGDDHEKGDSVMVKVLIDGQSIGFEDEPAARHMQNYVATLQSQLADAGKKMSAAEEEQAAERLRKKETDAALATMKDEFAAAKGEIAALKKQLEDAVAKSDQKTIDAAVKEKIELLLKADAVMDGKADFTGKEANEIRRIAVMAKMGDSAKDLSDAEMVGAFKILTANLKPRSGTDRLADSLSLLGQGGGSNQNEPKVLKDKAYGDYVHNLTGAWKTPAAAAR
jgi:uncharacterized protein